METIDERTCHSRPARSRRPFAAAAALVLGLLSSFAACSGGDQAPSAKTTGGAPDDGIGPDFPGPDTTAADRCATSKEFSACFDSCQQAQVGPASMFIMFDRSLSMKDNDKWPHATAALKSFFAAPTSAGLGVALRFFPEAGCEAPVCDVAACSTPAVPMGSLGEEAAPMDGQEEALSEAIDARYPDSGTPMHPALEGALAWATDALAKDPAQRTVVVLVTDGAPFGCHTHPDDVNADVADIAALAKDAYEQHGIYTYVVGLEGSWEWIVNAIASAGGTGQAILVGNDDTHDQLLAALQSIKESHIECAIDVAIDPNQGKLDPSLVNVTYTPSSGGAPETFGQVAGPDACGKSGGWYFDDPAAPSKIALCPSTCAEVQADKLAKLDVVLGCETYIAK